MTKLRIERDGDVAELARDQGRWQQVKPVHFPLMNAAVRDVIQAAGDLRYLDRFKPDTEGKPSLEDTGLASPRVVLTLQEGDTQHTIRLGRRLPGGHGYITFDDDQYIYIVNDALHDRLLDKTVKNWRQKTFHSPSATGAAHRSQS